MFRVLQLLLLLSLYRVLIWSTLTIVFEVHNVLEHDEELTSYAKHIWFQLCVSIIE